MVVLLGVADTSQSGYKSPTARMLMPPNVMSGETLQFFVSVCGFLATCLTQPCLLHR